jgi:hypothetical protein
MYPQRHLPFADQVKMIGVFAFPENDVSGLEAYVGNAADDGLDVLRGHIMEKRVRTQNALQSLHGDPPPSMGSDWVFVLPATRASRLHWTFAGAGLSPAEAHAFHITPRRAIGCRDPLLNPPSTLILLRRNTPEQNRPPCYPNSLLSDRHKVY